ncbi:MAG: 4,5-DOPA dioxygenase extradiol [candidate division KSB1 bacterium]|nr:4,5-DOPA dioxygenase extradiol [candidate division KSB1 bacterium]MDZ7356557.1 4,5-DOPA dioxygenase extradiol [candidate division KSB1 bacterium]MDZ7400458.1 4,5-DOPA dioxygenase extradiol [candidate division KSB1 bacterium]
MEKYWDSHSANKFGTEKEPTSALFVGHGSPMNAIEENEFSRAWIELGKKLPQPKAILCISAHWETLGTQVTAMDAPRTIHDFYGFPAKLYRQRYPASGSPQLAERIRQALDPVLVEFDFQWGLDHGTWSVLMRLFPSANIPVVQLSLNRTMPPTVHYQLGKSLRPLRDEGVLIIGSGNMVHNLGIMRWQDMAFDWAAEFDLILKRLIEVRDHEAIVNYQQFGRAAQLAIPTNEHFLPLLYVLAVQDADEPISFFAEKVTFGSISMRGVRIG